MFRGVRPGNLFGKHGGIVGKFGFSHKWRESGVALRFPPQSKMVILFTKACRKSVVSWTAVASNARHRFRAHGQLSSIRETLARSKAPSSLRCAGAVQDRAWFRSSPQQSVNNWFTQPQPNLCSIPRLQFHHVMRGGFFHAGRTDADITGLVAQLLQVRRTEVAHAGLDAANELA